MGIQLQENAVILGRSLVLPYYARPDLASVNLTSVGPLAAGFISVHTATSDFIEIPQFITFTFNTSAVVADRTLGILAKDADGNVKWQILCNGTQPANTSFRYTFTLDAGGSFVAGVFGMAMLPFDVMLPGESWRVFGNNLDAGDIQNGLTHTEQRIPTGPNQTTGAQTQTAVPIFE